MTVHFQEIDLSQPTFRIDLGEHTVPLLKELRRQMRTVNKLSRQLSPGPLFFEYCRGRIYARAPGSATTFLPFLQFDGEGVTLYGAKSVGTISLAGESWENVQESTSTLLAEAALTQKVARPIVKWSAYEFQREKREAVEGGFAEKFVRIEPESEEESSEESWLVTLSSNET